MLPNTNLQYCIIALYVLLKLFGLQMEDWAIEGWTLGKLAGREQARGRWWWWWEGGGGRLWGEGVQNSCLALVVMCEFDLLYCCSSETSLNPFWLVNVFLQAPSGTLLSQDEIDQILQIWTSMQRQIVSPTTMIVINEEKIIAVKTQL